MIKKIDQVLRSISPSLHQKVKLKYNDVKKRIHPKLSEAEFKEILTNRLQIKSGDIVFIHSSMRSLYLNFRKDRILPILKETVGDEGTLLFPCWQFNTRAEDFINSHNPVFDFKKSPSAMGKLSDELRFDPNSFRSFHPTNSVVAVGKFAEELTFDHQDDIYPCGEKSPFFKMKKYGAKIIGIGVTVDNLTFVHSVEDTIDYFPIKTRMDKVFGCTCIDAQGKSVKVNTLVASEAIQNRDVFGFFKNYIKQSEYVFFKKKGMNFFSVDSGRLYNEMCELAKVGKTIYKNS